MTQPTSGDEPAGRPVVAIVHLGRAGGMGGLRRVAGLTSVFGLAGASVHELLLRVDHRPTMRDVSPTRMRRLVQGRLVPEALSWSASSALQALHALSPDLVICETARAFDPSFAEGSWRLVLDYVDRLSVSYRDRSMITGPLPRRLLFGALSPSAARFERWAERGGVHAIAAGWADAENLSAEWVPITYDVPSQSTRHPDHDLLFFGNLSYPPNVEAVDRLARLWPSIEAGRPGTTMLLAGANPLPRLRRRAVELGWTLAVDFIDLGELTGSARLGIVTLTHASGIQTKVLEAAALGLPQIVDPVAVAGMRAGFPVAIARTDEQFADETVRLLGDDEALATLGAAARDHMRAHYTAEAFVPWARRQLPVPD